jgi:23S rRNA (uracil1939-C5)-methyltransferase
VVAVRECPVHDQRGNAIAFDLLDRCQHAAIEADQAQHSGPDAGPGRRRVGPAAGRDAGVLRSLAVRVGEQTGERMATLVVRADADRRLRTATRQLLASDAAPTSFHLNVHTGSDPFIFGAETRRLAGPERLREEVGGVSFLLSPAAFFQTNVRAAEILVRLVTGAVPDGARVLDLYAGAGLFALPLAHAGHTVVAVEESRTAVADGEASRRLNRIPAGRCRFIARPVEAALGMLRPSDMVILDPPRQGCSPAVLAHVFGRLQPPQGVYVSCDPEALARDAAIIASLGYRLDSIQPVDMFPHTAHIETVVTLSRQPEGGT